MRLFYATTAPADFIGAHKAWEAGSPSGDGVALTFSGQIESFISAYGGKGLFVSGHPDRRHFGSDWLEIRHLPRKPASGWRWHLEYSQHAKRLLRLAEDFGADIAVLDSGTMSFRSMEAFHKRGMRAVPVFHNTPYAIAGRSIWEKVEWVLARSFLERTDPICVSPECLRQVGHGIEIRAQFRKDYFKRVAPAQFERPFNVLFVGRIDETKGVFDIVQAARLCGNEITWTICGDGPDLEKLKKDSEGLPIEIRGWTSADDQIELRSRCQAIIVPTRSNFAEGMAMSAVEAILSRRPLITNRAVPALEVLRPACVETKPDDPASISEAILGLSRDRQLWQSLIEACPDLEAPFYDRRRGLSAALAKIIFPMANDYVAP